MFCCFNVEELVILVSVVILLTEGVEDILLLVSFIYIWLSLWSPLHRCLRLLAPIPHLYCLPDPDPVWGYAG